MYNVEDSHTCIMLDIGGIVRLLAVGIVCGMRVGSSYGTGW